MSEHTTESLLLASLPQGLVASDRQRRISFINPAAARLLELDVDQWVGQPLDAFCEAYSIPAPEALFGHRQLIDASERRLYAQALQLPATSARANLVFALMLSPEDAELQAMTNFVAVVSSELRAPLTVIRGYANLLLRDHANPLDADHKELVECLNQRANDMSGFISNLIIIMSIDTGRLRADHEAIDLKSAIEAALAPLQGQITAKGLGLAVELDKNLPLALGDREMVRRALYPLLDNARRYTAAGGIIIRAAAHAGSVQVEIEDTGHGIIPELQAYLAQPITPGGIFSWMSNFSSATGIYRGGTGLGLAVCKGLIALQGGTMWATSTPGQGSRFCFTLPIAQEA